jgi:phage shock protein A
MRPFKRLFATLTTGFDSFIDQVENHEAVAEAVVADVRRQAARLKVQIARLDQHIGTLGQQHQQALDEAGQWRERALRVAEDDDKRGLYCAAQYRDVEARARKLATQISEHTVLRANVQRELTAVEDKLNELQLRKTLLSSRSAHADASKVAAGVAHAECDAEGVFERWETRITQNEYLTAAGTPIPVDPLRTEFEEQERDAALREQLSAWRDDLSKPAGKDKGA